MGVIIASVILSVVVIIPTIAGVFLRGPGLWLRVTGVVLVLPLIWLWLLFGANYAFDVRIGNGDAWTGVIYFIQAFAVCPVCAVGAFTGGIGRAKAAR